MHPEPPPHPNGPDAETLPARSAGAAPAQGDQSTPATAEFLGLPDVLELLRADRG
ncbi:hypothetical protein [Pseudonocardia kunmingensis]|uniref:hypothetical protein n=1 Tax=Pseudonocardia kunmingensis TaxID=630975 RepID=UPI0014787BAC|nr:hypothetical protein [Pseudonocardia kunmingensis]